MYNYYVIQGNEYGTSIDTKKNFKFEVEAFEYYYDIIENGELDFIILLIRINDDGSETIIKQYCEEF